MARTVAKTNSHVGRFGATVLKPVSRTTRLPPSVLGGASAADALQAGAGTDGHAGGSVAMPHAPMSDTDSTHGAPDDTAGGSVTTAAQRPAIPMAPKVRARQGSRQRRTGLKWRA